AQGCDWLLERWQALARSLEPGRPWDDARRSLALDLLGVPAALRDGRTPADGPDAVATQAALAAAQVAEIERLKADVMDGRDEIEYESALAGRGAGDAATERSLALTRRYESACQRRLERSLGLRLRR